MRASSGSIRPYWVLDGGSVDCGATTGQLHVLLIDRGEIQGLHLDGWDTAVGRLELARRLEQWSRYALGADGRRELVEAFVAAWERADVATLLALLAEDARFTMPPLPALFLDRQDIGRFFTQRMFATPWRLVPIRANGQYDLRADGTVARYHPHHQPRRPSRADCRAQTPDRQRHPGLW